MKKTDIALIAFIAAISVGIAYFIGSSIFSNINETDAKVKTIDVITGTLQEPSEQVFNDNAINPAVKVQVDGTEKEKTTDKPPVTQPTTQDPGANSPNGNTDSNSGTETPVGDTGTSNNATGQ